MLELIIECVRRCRQAARKASAYQIIGKTTDDCRLIVNGEADDLDVIVAKWQQPLEGVFPVRTADFREKTDTTEVEKLHYTERNTSGPKIQVARPKVVIPAFPGTNCEMDSARAFEKAGAEADIHIIRNLTAAQLARFYPGTGTQDQRKPDHHDPGRILRWRRAGRIG